MLHQEEVKQFTLDSVAEVLAKLSDTLSPPLHADLYDDGASAAASPGRVASFELDANGKVTWWTWRSDDACARAEWPLKLRLEFGDEDRIVVWLRGGQSWSIEDYRGVQRNRPAQV